MKLKHFLWCSFKKWNKLLYQHNIFINLYILQYHDILYLHTFWLYQVSFCNLIKEMYKLTFVIKSIENIFIKKLLCFMFMCMFDSSISMLTYLHVHVH